MEPNNNNLSLDTLPNRYHYDYKFKKNEWR
jgi:hypothetical protein